MAEFVSAVPKKLWQKNCDKKIVTKKFWQKNFDKKIQIKFIMCFDQNSRVNLV